MARHEIVDPVGNGHTVKEQLESLSTEKLWAEMDALNKQLGNLGVEEPISNIIHAGSMNGCRYEDVHSRRGGPADPTPNNCFMALLTYQPELRKRLPDDEFQVLNGVVARVSQTFEILFDRTGPFDWPPSFTQSPK